VTKKEKASRILTLLKKQFPHPKTALDFGNPFQLLVATILSAQTTDTHVNKVTKGLFSRYPTVKAFAEMSLSELEEELKSVNFYRNKARNIRESARRILEVFRGAVPDTMEELLSLPGVARKTANIVLWNGFGIIGGIAVDTHVKRVAGRLGLTSHRDPVKIESDLMDIVPRKDWGNLSHYLIFHGRTVCAARNPKHGECVLSDLCPSRDS